MESSQQPWKIWIFVIGLNTFAGAGAGAFYRRSIGIDLYAFRGGS